MARNPAPLTFTIFAALLASSGFSLSTKAAEWSATPSISLQELYNDNFLLTTTPEPAVTGTVITPRVDLTAQQENWNLTGTTQWTNSRYSGQSGLDTNGQYLYLNSSFKTQRSTWQLAGTYANESVLTGTQNVSDIGLVHTQMQRITRNIGPTWTWAISDTSQVQVAYQRSDVSYGSSGAAAQLYDYTQDSSSLTLARNLSERTQIFGVVNYTDFHVPVMQISGTNVTSKTTSGELGVSENFTERLTGSLYAGAQNTRTSGTQCDPIILSLFGQCFLEPTFTKDSGSVYNASLQEQFETGNMSLVLSRAVAPSGAGTQVQTDTDTFSVNTQLSERLGGAVYFNYYRIHGIGQSLSGVDRNLYSGGPSLRWRWTENLTATAAYQYMWQKDTDPNSQSAASNAVFLSLSYAWPAFAISR